MREMTALHCIVVALHCIIAALHCNQHCIVGYRLQCIQRRQPAAYVLTRILTVCTHFAHTAHAVPDLRADLRRSSLPQAASKAVTLG